MQNYKFGNNIVGKKIIQNENHTKNLQLFYKKKYWYAAPTNLVPCLFIDFVNRKHAKHLHVLIIIKSLTAQEIGELLVFKVHW